MGNRKWLPMVVPGGRVEQSRVKSDNFKQLPYSYSLRSFHWEVMPVLEGLVVLLTDRSNWTGQCAAASNKSGEWLAQLLLKKRLNPLTAY